MAKSNILKELANNQICLEVALSRLMIIASDIQDEKLYKWAIAELNGYSHDDILPPYRMRRSGVVRYTGISGNFKVTNALLPTQFIPDKINDELYDAKIYDGIKTISSFANSNQGIGVDLSSLIGTVYANSGIQCTNLQLQHDPSLFKKVLDSIRTKLLAVFIELDKCLGNLDDLDVSIENANVAKLKQTIYNIIFDNSIKIGDSNKIENTQMTGGNE